jgi:hypothetical protein
MSQIHPDIPELEGVPHVLRSRIWLRAERLALFSPQALGLALVWMAAGTTAGALLGFRLLSTWGAMLMGAAAMCLAGWLFLRYALQWLARRRLPEVQREASWTAEDHRLVGIAKEFDAVVAEYNRREGLK